jgi:hypothetical protein
MFSVCEIPSSPPAGAGALPGSPCSISAPNNPFPDYQTAERTWIAMLEVQLEHFTKTPLLTNTQPDYSRVGC